MSAVIEFPADRAGRPKGTEMPAGTNSAEIVIFPGVRIERPGFSLADRLTPQRPRGQAMAQAHDFDGL